MVRVLLAIGRVSLSNARRNSDDGGRFRAQAARTQLLERAAVRSCRLQFALGEATFGADEKGWPLAVGRWPRLGVRIEDDFFSFASDDVVERLRLFDFGDSRSARLLHGLEDDPVPAFLFAAIAFSAHLNALGDH